MAALDLDELEQENEEDEGEVLTPAQVLEKLEEAWVNEKFSPELLEVQGEVLDCMLEQIATMEENVSRARPGDFRVPIHRMEIDRIRYVITSYLRCRLKKGEIKAVARHSVFINKAATSVHESKIEKFTAQVLEKEEARKEDDNPLMTSGELQYAKQYMESVYNHMKVLAIDFMPNNFRNKPEIIKQTATRPDLDSYVFLRVKEDTANVLVEEETADTGEEIVNLEKGDQHIMRYRPISSLVKSGAVALI